MSVKRKGRVFRRGRIWYVDVSVDGERQRFAAAQRKSEAELVLARLLLGQDAETEPRGTDTLSDAVEAWLEHAAEKKSLATDRQRLGRVLELMGSKTRLRDVQPRDLDRLRARLLETPTAGRSKQRTLSPGTVNRHLDAFRSVLTLAVRNGWLDRSPAEKMRRAREPEARDRICSPREFERLLEANPSDDMRLALVLGYELGLRRGEVFRLTWRDIDFEAGILTVQLSKTGRRRLVPLSKLAVEALRAHPKRTFQPEVMHTSIKSFGHRWERLCARAGVEGLHFHDLRHTAATRFRRAGVDLVTVKRIGGWSSWKTMERYQTIDSNDLRKAIRAREAHES